MEYEDNSMYGGDGGGNEDMYSGGGAGGGSGGGGAGGFKKQMDIMETSGVNISEEFEQLHSTILSKAYYTAQHHLHSAAPHQRITDEFGFVVKNVLRAKLKAILRKNGLQDADEETERFFGHALELRMRDFIEKLSVSSEHRHEVFRTLYPTIVTGDTKRQLAVLARIDNFREIKRVEVEREAALRALKNRKNLDEEQLERIRKIRAIDERREQQVKANQTMAMAFGGGSKRPSFLNKSGRGDADGDDDDFTVVAGEDAGLKSSALGLRNSPAQLARLDAKPQPFSMASYPHKITLKDVLMQIELDPYLRKTQMYSRVFTKAANFNSQSAVFLPMMPPSSSTSIQLQY